MAIGTALAIAGGVSALSAAAGAIPKKSEASYGVDAGNATGLENYGQGMLQGNAQQLSDLVSKGPGAQDVENATGSARDLASILDQYSKGGYLPGEKDIATGNDLASKLFQAQRVQLGQNFQDQTNQFNQQAALMGRDPMDPVFRNKLAQEQTRQGAMLDAQQGSFATQLAMDSPLQRLNFASQKAQVQGGLASQALANRQALAAMGEGIMNTERNFRLQTATRWGNQSSDGGLAGAINGGLAGLGVGAGLAKGFGFDFQQQGPTNSQIQSGADSFVSQLYKGAGSRSPASSIPGYGQYPGGADMGPPSPFSNTSPYGPLSNGGIYGDFLNQQSGMSGFGPFSSGDIYGRGIGSPFQQFANRYGK